MKHSREKLWVVVAVESGIPVIVEGFRSKDQAHKLASRLRRDSNPEEDEVAVFQIGVSHGK